MKKLESTFISMFVVLSLIALVSAALLSFTYGKTSVVRAEVERDQQQRALAEVLPDFDNSPVEEAFTREEYELQELYPDRKSVV
jgi:Na+-translocating ferredoxin:NAD+ oxidoreductase subunit G